MIFSDKIYKICSGDNVTIYFEDDNKLNIFTYYNKCIQNLSFSLINNVTSTFKPLNVSYDYVKQIDDNLFVVGYENNMSVVNGL